jgi:hypothetical protein
MYVLMCIVMLFVVQIQTNMCVKSIRFVAQDFSPVYKCDCVCRAGQLNGYKNDFTI